VIGGRCVGHGNPDFWLRQTQAAQFAGLRMNSAALRPPEIVALICADLMIGKDRQVRRGDLRHESRNM
jgi:hypothetical protein